MPGPIKTLDFRPLAALPTDQGLSLQPPNVPTSMLSQKDGEGFAGQLDLMVSDARQRDVAAQGAVESFARGEDPGRIHETLIAVSKAEISLRTLAAVRNKLVDAYRELLHVTT